MEIRLKFSSENREKLESDIAEFKKLNLNFPIEEPLPGIAMDSIARSDYRRQEWDGKREWGRIEFGNDHFKNKKKERMLTILHEIIHLHFLSNNLYDWMKKRKKFWNTMRKEIMMHYDNKKLRNELGRKLNLIANVLNILDEIWAEIYMKRNYPEHFEIRKVFFYKIRKKNVEKKTPEWNRLQKFVWFWQLLHISFFMKLIEEGDKQNIELFKKLYKTIEGKLNSIIDEKEKELFKEYGEKLCRFDAYPESSQLEQNYLEFANYVLNI